MSNENLPSELANIIVQLRKQLKWLDRNGYSRAAIDVNSALEQLAPSKRADLVSRVRD